MIDRITGFVIEKNPAFAVVDVNGIGYQVNITLPTYDTLGSGEKVTLFTHFAVREDAHVLYGFADKHERELFRLLISVSGVGPATGLTILSSLPAQELKNTIASGDVGALKKVKGIGPKSAQRILIDLRDKVGTEVDNFDNFGASSNTIKLEALSALHTLGFDKKTAEKAVDQALANEDGSINVEDLIRKVLRGL